MYKMNQVQTLYSRHSRKIYSEKTFRIFRKLQKSGLLIIRKNDLIHAIKIERKNRDCFISEILSGEMSKFKIEIIHGNKVISEMIIGKEFGSKIEVIENMIYFRTQDFTFSLSRNCEIDVFKGKEGFEVSVIC